MTFRHNGFHALQMLMLLKLAAMAVMSGDGMVLERWWDGASQELITYARRTTVRLGRASECAQAHTQHVYIHSLHGGSSPRPVEHPTYTRQAAALPAKLGALHRVTNGRGECIITCPFHSYCGDHCASLLVSQQASWGPAMALM